MIAELICAHLVGDYLLQNHWMQRKAQSSWVCTVHVLCYSLPFLVIALLGSLPVWALVAILAQHWLQDRFALHLKWMAFYGQTPPEKWPVGPLCVDQAWHLAFLWLIGSVLSL